MAKKPVCRKASPKKRTPRKPSRARTLKAAAKRAPKRAPKRASKQASARSLNGWITHTEFASTNPSATKLWCAKVLGWTFKPSVSTPTGDYHLFMYSAKAGGGIRSSNPPEVPGTIPYVQVPDARAAFEKALREGAEVMMAPERIMEGVTIAIVRAPGGVPIGFAGP